MRGTHEGRKTQAETLSGRPTESSPAFSRVASACSEMDIHVTNVFVCVCFCLEGKRNCVRITTSSLHVYAVLFTFSGLCSCE